MIGGSGKALIETGTAEIHFDGSSLSALRSGSTSTWRPMMPSSKIVT
ncbi:MAG: hypothetical protein HOV76_32120 [Hamadaea sp.]|nr:hypothetical protein [Hamadaea sp.]